MLEFCAEPCLRAALRSGAPNCVSGEIPAKHLRITSLHDIGEQLIWNDILAKKGGRGWGGALCMPNDFRLLLGLNVSPRPLARQPSRSGDEIGLKAAWNEQSRKKSRGERGLLAIFHEPVRPAPMRPAPLKA